MSQVADAIIILIWIVAGVVGTIVVCAVVALVSYLIAKWRYNHGRS